MLPLESFIRARNESIIVPLNRTDGIEMRLALARIFSLTNFDTSLIARYGALSLDVYCGADLVTIAPYGPIRHTVSEPIKAWDDKVVHGGLERRLAIEALGEGTDLSIIDGDPLDGIAAVISQKSSVGLVTMLNTYPTRVEQDYLSTVGRYAKDILVPGGLMVLSVREDTEADVDKVLEEWTNLRVYGLQRAPEITYRYYQEEKSRAGVQYVLASKAYSALEA